MHHESETTTETTCGTTGRFGRDGRQYCACGSIANPAGFCSEYGTPIAIPEDAYVVDTNGAHLHFISQHGRVCDWCEQVQDLTTITNEGTK